MKITLITGASSGLGRELAILYAKDNNNLLLVGTNLKELELTKELVLKENNVICDVMVADLSEKIEMEKVYNYTLEKNYFVNNLVNNAGFGDRCDFKDMDVDFQLKMTEVNCNAVLYFTNVFIKKMLEEDEGHIINVGSIAGFLPGPYMATYHACKGFILLLGEAISHEIRKTNVKLLTLCPGPFMSKFVEKAHNDYTFKKIKPIKASEVARIAYKSSKKGKSLVVVGVKNKLTIFLTRLVPRKMTTSISAQTMKKGD